MRWTCMWLAVLAVAPAQASGGGNLRAQFLVEGNIDLAGTFQADVAASSIAHEVDASLGGVSLGIEGTSITIHWFESVRGNITQGQAFYEIPPQDGEDGTEAASDGVRLETSPGPNAVRIFSLRQQEPMRVPLLSTGNVSIESIRGQGIFSDRGYEGFTPAFAGRAMTSRLTGAPSIRLTPTVVAGDFVVFVVGPSVLANGARQPTGSQDLNSEDLLGAAQVNRKSIRWAAIEVVGGRLDFAGPVGQWDIQAESIVGAASGAVVFRGTRGHAELENVTLDERTGLLEAVGWFDVEAHNVEGASDWSINGEADRLSVDGKVVFQTGPVATAAAAAVFGGLLVGFLALYNLAKLRPLAHDGRQRILGLVADEPGLGAREIARSLSVGRATALFHLRVLEKTGHVQSREVGQVRAYFLNGGSSRFQLESNGPGADFVLRIMQHPLRKTLARLVTSNSNGMSAADLRSNWPDAPAPSKSVVAYNLKVMERAGIVRKPHGGRRYLAALDLESIMRHHHDAYLRVRGLTPLHSAVASRRFSSAQEVDAAMSRQGWAVGRTRTAIQELAAANFIQATPQGIMARR